MISGLHGSHVYILDGIWGSHRRWTDLSQRLVGHGASVTIWHYQNSGRLQLADLGDELAREISSSTSSKIHCVGYSMGGLVIRAALRKVPKERINRVAFLHSPQEGSFGAWLFPFLPSAKDMRPGSDFLTTLSKASWPWETMVTWCPFDLMVLPGWSANWSGATRSFCSLVPAHAWPVFSRGIHQRVVDFFLQSKLANHPDSEE